jgi:acetate kinase
MGFSPLEGVPMTTRSGSVDPGAIVHGLREHGVDAATLDHELNFESGMKALGGGSGDIREVGDFALDVFSYRVAAAVGAIAVALDGLDALAFTAGIGENSARVRASICARLSFLGVELDDDRNEHAVPDCVISRGNVAVHVVQAREELVAARAARALLG